MRGRLQRLVTVAAVVGAILSVGAAPSARTGPKPASAVGIWAGFAGSDPFSLDVTSRRGSRMSGKISLVRTAPIPTEGIFTRTGRVVAIGRDGSARSVLLTGATDPLSGKARRLPTLLEGRLCVAGDGVSMGPAGLVHLVDGPVELATAHGGNWSGRTQGPGPVPVHAHLSDADRGGMGTLQVGDSFFDVFFDIHQVKGAETHGFGLVGGGDAGIIIVGGTFTRTVTRQPHIEATYRKIDIDGFIRAGTFAIDLRPVPLPLPVP